ncbi:IS5 family transposase [Thermus caldilimi]|uniref:IS5 family transposase n=1 Tax=Thermus caldilimi TaxID=2483360 RepID=UPI001075EAF5|nr:IS5 family transposase [Thermus caldilimi]
MKRKAYPSDVTDEEWSLVAPYLTLMREDAPQREYPLREVFNALRWIVRTGAPWRMLPHDFPPWEVVYAKTQRWLKAGVFQALVHDLRALLRTLEGREPDPSAVVLDSRTLPATPESGHRAGYDGAKRRRGSKVHMAVDTLGHLLALVVTPADVGDREEVGRLAREVQEATGERVEVAFVDQGYTGERAAEAARRGLVLLPRRWVVERSFAWLTRFRRLVRDYERLPETVAGLHFLAFAMLLLKRFVDLLGKVINML